MDPVTLTLISMGIKSVIGLGNAVAGNLEDNNQVAAYKEQLQRTQEEKNSTLSLLDIEFEEAQKQAYKNADRSDAQSTMAEKTTSNNINSNIQALGLQDIANAYSFNNASQTASASKGKSLASMAASGTRTSSMGSAVEMSDRQSQDQLQLNEDMSRIQSDAQLNNLLSALGQDVFQISNNRQDAEELRQAYNDGGYAAKESDGTILGTIKNSFQNLINAKTGEMNNYAGAGSEYRKYMLNRNRANNSYNYQISNLNKAISDIEDHTTLRAIQRFFTGASESNNVANSITSNINDFLGTNYNTKTNWNFSSKVVSPSASIFNAIPTFDQLSQPFSKLSINLLG